MAVTATPALPQTPKHGFVTISSGTGSSALVTLYTGGTNGTKITSVLVSNGDVNAAQISVGITSSGGTFGPISSWLAVAASTGVGDGPMVAVLSTTNCPVDNDGNPYVFLNSSLETIQVKGATVPTSSGPGTYYFHAFAADF